MAPRLPMPRITLKRRPSSRNDSPGLSSVPASIEPIITLSAPAASAFTTSPEYLMPPSAITGMSPCPAPRTPSTIAVICGTPTPVTTRVVQIDPGPTTTFTASTPRSTNARAPASVATLPPTSCASGCASRRQATVLSTPSEWRCADRAVELARELQVAVGYVTHQAPGVVHDRHPRDVEPLHQAHGLAQRPVRPEGDRVQDHPRLAALHFVHLGRLAVDRHVLVDHADAALTRDRDRHLRFGDRVHRGGHEGDVEGNAAGEARAHVDIPRVHAREPRNE